jgi:hypothetical protein
MITFFGESRPSINITGSQRKEASTWTETAGKAINFFLTVSIVLSLIASRPGLIFLRYRYSDEASGML